MCRALQVYSGVITLGRVILCGSIVRQDYDWSLVFTKNFVGSALNDCGRLDIWAGNVQRFISDAGPSGRAGFTTKHDRLVERFHPEWKHSDFFFDLNFEKRWIPYLKGDAVPEAQFEPTSSVPKTLIFLLLLLVGIGIWAFIHFRIGRFFWK